MPETDPMRNFQDWEVLENNNLHSFVAFANYHHEFELFTDNAAVAARLRSLRTNDPLNKGHPRSIEKEIELCQTYFRN